MGVCSIMKEKGGRIKEGEGFLRESLNSFLSGGSKLGVFASLNNFSVLRGVEKLTMDKTRKDSSN